MADRLGGIDRLIDEGRLVISCGPGGVGKTTTSATIALRAAMRGKSALVLTIDPARRLATAMGLENLSCVPQRIDKADCEGSLWAMMLDTRETFDSLVDRLSGDPDTARRIKGSRLYGIFAGSMHGTAEYMALESLHDVYTSGQFDLVVLDTPPLTNALDFFKVPDRASWMFDRRVMRWFIPREESRGIRALLRPGAVVMRLLKYLAGPTLVDDITEFFEALQVIGEQLKQRGEEVARILRAADTRYIVVTGAADRRISEALYLDDQLRELGRRAELFVINRSHHGLSGLAEQGPGVIAAQLREAMGDVEGFDALAAESHVALEALAQSGKRHQGQIERLAQRVGQGNVSPVADLARDISSMDDLVKLGEALS